MKRNHHNHIIITENFSIKKSGIRMDSVEIFDTDRDERRILDKNNLVDFSIYCRLFRKRESGVLFQQFADFLTTLFDLEFKYDDEYGIISKIKD